METIEIIQTGIMLLILTTQIVFCCRIRKDNKKIKDELNEIQKIN